MSRGRKVGMKTLLHAARALANGSLRARDLIEDSLARIADPQGEGARTFMSVDADRARAQADRVDARRNSGRAELSPAGIPVSVKDLFDQAGHVTKAGSRVLEDAPAATADASAIARLTDAGAIALGRTVMTEFAFSGVGINPHYGTPANPYARAERRIPGGSSSGAAVSVSDGMALLGVGSDTGGSCRIPAALCGVVGVKPTQALIPRTGTVPLSTTLDTVGAFAASVACARFGVRAMAGQDIDLADPPIADLHHLRLGVLTDYVLGGMDADVSAAWERTLSRLSARGADLRPCPFPELNTLPQLNARGGFPAPESLTWHRALVERMPERYDPFVLKRILRGREQSAVDYIELLAGRARLMATAVARMAGFDALLMPTVPIVAPTITALEADEDRYVATNLLLLRNPTVVNILDLCAISLPCHSPGTAPVGLSVIGAKGGDEDLFAVAGAIETALR
jgi:aspartyl-tRNA(Asn)/glutamyl-tRNA(Gln) amidotransferase subunit A